LVEILVATGISGLVLIGVVSAAFQITRSGTRVTHYAEADTQVRRAFEQLTVDLQAASAITYNGVDDFTVTVARSDESTTQFTYAWNSTTRAFYRVPGAASSSTTGRLWLISGVSAFAFARLDAGGAAVSTDTATKRINVSLTVTRSTSQSADATFKAAATFMLRNKTAS